MYLIYKLFLTLDGTADNVDKDFNKIKGYYGSKDENIEPNMGSVSDIQVIPIKSPEEPRNLTVEEGYRSLTISWENHRQARDFDIFYRKLGDDDKKWIKANDPRVTLAENEVDNTTKDLDKNKLHRSHSYTLRGLDDESTYEVRVSATNHLGTSKMSQIYLGTTTTLTPPLHRSHSYTLRGLDDESTYEVRVSATNHLGTSKMSQIYLGTTTTLTPPKMPNYNVINMPKANVEDGQIPVENIEHLGTSKMSQIYLGTTTTLTPPKMPNYNVINMPKANVEDGQIPVENIEEVINSKVSSASYDNEFAVVDNDYSTNYTVDHWRGDYVTPTVVFKEEYSIDRISMAWNAEYENVFEWPGLYEINVRVKDKDGNLRNADCCI